MNEELKAIIEDYNSRGYNSTRIARRLMEFHGVEGIGREQLIYLIDEYNSGSLGQAESEIKEEAPAEPVAETEVLDEELKKKDHPLDSGLSSEGPLSAYMPQPEEEGQRLEFDFTQRPDATITQPLVPSADDYVVDYKEDNDSSVFDAPQIAESDRRKIDDFTYSDEVNKIGTIDTSPSDEFLEAKAKDLESINNSILEKRKRIEEINSGAEGFESSGFGKKEVYLSLNQKELDGLNKEINELELESSDYERLISYNVTKRTEKALNNVMNGRFSGATMSPDEARRFAEEAHLIMNDPSITVDQVYESMIDNNLVIIDENSVYQDKLYDDLSVAVYDRDNLYKVDYRKAEVPPQFKLSKEQFFSNPDEYLSKVPNGLKNFEDAKKEYRIRHGVDMTENDYLDLVSFWNYRESAINAIDQNEFIEKSIIEDYENLIKNSTDENLTNNYFRFLNENRDAFDQYNKNVDLLGYGNKAEDVLGLLVSSLQSEVSEDISNALFSYQDSSYKSGIRAAANDELFYQSGIDRTFSKASLNMGAGVLDFLQMLQDYEKGEDDSWISNLLYVTPAAGAKLFADIGGGEGIVDFGKIAEDAKEFARGVEDYDRINMGLTLNEAQKDISVLIGEGNIGAAIRKGTIATANVIPQIGLAIAAPQLAVPMFGVSSAGSMYSEVKDLDHITYGEKVAYSVIAGAAEAATEYLFRGQEVLSKEIVKTVLRRKAIGKGILDEAKKKAIAKQTSVMFKFNPKSRIGKTFLNTLQFSEEGFEEAIVDIVDQSITNHLERKDLDLEHEDLKYRLEEAPNQTLRDEILKEIQANREKYSEIGYNIYRTMDSFGLGVIGGSLPLMVTKSLAYVATPGKIKSRIKISSRIKELDKLISEEADMQKRINLKAEKAALIRKQFSDVAMDQQLLEKMSEEDLNRIIELNHEISSARFSSRRLRASINENMSLEEQDKIYESIMKNAEKAKKALEGKIEIENRYLPEQNKIEQNSLTDEEVMLVNEIESLDADIDTFESLPNSDGFIDVTNENVTEVINNLASSPMIKSTKFATAQQIKEGLRNVAKIVKEVKSGGGSVRVFTNKNDFERVTGQSISRGLHQTGKGSDTVVSLYLPALKANTAYHEAFHDVVLRKLGDGKIKELALFLAKGIPEEFISKYVQVMDLTEQQLLDVKDLNGYSLLEYIIREDEGRAEEFLVEVLADITNGDYTVSMKNGLIQNLKNFVSKFFGTTFKNPKISDVISAIQTATEQMARGEEVTALNDVRSLQSESAKLFRKIYGMAIPTFSTSMIDEISESKLDSDPSSKAQRIATVEDISETQDTKSYSDAMALAVQRMKEEGKKEYIQVTLLSEDDLNEIVSAGGRMFMSNDGMSGGYVMPDGYMGGLFKNPDSELKGMSKPMQQVRKAAGGKFFDAFATKLETMYIENGYKPVGRLDFNEEYAPEGWNDPDSPLKDKPDVVFFIEGDGGKPGDGVRIDEYMDAYNAASNLANEATALDESGVDQTDGSKISDGAKKQVIGENAEFAGNELLMLNDAISMEIEGYTPKQIFSSTGWEKGKDGKWRMFFDAAIDDYYGVGLDIQEELFNTEIEPPSFDPESGMEIPGEGSVLSKKGSEVIPESILELYPSLGDITVLFHRNKIFGDKNGDLGIFSASLNTIDIAVQMDMDLEMTLEDGVSIDEYYEDRDAWPEHALVLAHEVQHAIQKIEGFQGGVSASGGTLLDSLMYSNSLFEDKGDDAPKLENITVDEQDHSDGSTTYSVVDYNESAVYNLYGVFNNLSEAEKLREDVVNDHKDRYDLFKDKFKGYGDLKKINASVAAELRELAYLGAMGEVEARAVEAKMLMREEARNSMMTSEVMSSVNPLDAVIIERGVSKKQVIDDEGGVDFEITNEGVDPASNPNMVLRKTIARAIKAYPSLREELRSNPENYITPQKLKELEESLSDETSTVTDADLIDIMTDDALGRLQNRNDDLSVMALNELINRAIAKGDWDSVSKYETERAKIGTTGGRILRHLRGLKSTTPTSLTRLIEREVEKKGNTLTEEQKDELKKRFEKILNLQREKDQLAKEMAKLDVIDGNIENSIKNNDFELLEAEKALNVYLNSIVEKGWGDIYTMLVQGNLLTPMSQVTNIGANTVNIFGDFFRDAVAFPMEKVLNLFGAQSPVKRRYSLMAYLYAAKMGALSTVDVIESSLTGKGIDAKSEWRMERGFYPIQSLISALTKKDLPLKTKGRREGKISMNQRAKLFVQASFGAPAEVMFRALSLGDVPFRRYAEGLELYRIAKAKNLKGDKLKKFLKYPDKKSLEYAEREGRKVTYQEETETSKSAMAAVSSLQRGISKSIFTVSGGLINGDEWGKAIVRTFLPYVNTPANIFDETMTYMVPWWALVKIGKDIRNGDAISASQNFGKMVVGSMAVQVGLLLIKEGLITGPVEWDDDEKKNLAYDQLPPSSVNIDGLKRLLKGEDPSWREGDEFKQYLKLGIIGQVMGATVKSTNPDELRKRDYSDFKFFHHAFFDGFGLSTLSGASNIFDQSFLQGIDGILQVLASVGEDDFERSAERLVNSVVRASSSAVLPNSMSAFARAERDFMPDYRLDKNISSPERVIKNFEYVIKDRFWSDRNVPARIDWRGEKVLQTPEGSSKVAYQLFDITKSRKGSSDPISNEIMRLYQSTGEVSEAMGTPKYAQNTSIQVPKGTRQRRYIPKKYTFLNDEDFVGQRVNLSVEQCNKLMEVAGKERYKYLDYVVNTGKYKKSSDEDKLKMLEKVNDLFSGSFEVDKAKRKMRDHSLMLLDFFQEIYEKQKNEE